MQMNTAKREKKIKENEDTARDSIRHFYFKMICEKHLFKNLQSDKIVDHES